MIYARSNQSFTFSVEILTKTYNFGVHRNFLKISKSYAKSIGEVFLSDF